MAKSEPLILLTSLLAAVAIAGCGSSDPAERILEQRALWDVAVLSWAQGEDGAINISTRISGPPNSKIDKLTVRIKLLDSAESVIDTVWHTYDLGKAPRGGPADLFIRIPLASESITALALDMALMPSPEERQHIEELQL
jgi:hypothetical protein